MPTVRLHRGADVVTVVCPAGTTLRSALLAGAASPHNQSHLVSCQGLGSCGTCAVEVLAGEVGAPTAMERWRLAFPPHRDGPTPMRLACQVRVTADLEVRKHPGFWGPAGG